MNVLLSILMFVVGTVVVLGVMALVAWVTGMLESLESPQAAFTASAPASASVASPAAPVAPPAASIPSPAPDLVAGAVGSNIEPTTVAVITAAITAALAGRPFRIQKIKLAGGPVLTTTSWAQSGRQMIHASHAIERKFR